MTRWEAERGTVSRTVHCHYHQQAIRSYVVYTYRGYPDIQNQPSRPEKKKIRLGIRWQKRQRKSEQKKTGRKDAKGPHRSELPVDVVKITCFVYCSRRVADRESSSIDSQAARRAVRVLSSGLPTTVYSTALHRFLTAPGYRPQ
jgi:hypothetical protein